MHYALYYNNLNIKVRCRAILILVSHKTAIVSLKEFPVNLLKIISFSLIASPFSIMYILWLSFLIVYVAICEAQFLYHQSSGIGGNPYYQSSGAGQFAHPAVVDNSLRESQLPPELSKSHRFLNNPHIAAALAKDSWFTGNEMPVFDREAEKIPRDMVYKLFKNAGWIKRR